MSTQIDSLSIKIESSSRDATAAIDQMTKALQQLKTAGGLGTIEKNIQKIANAVTKGMKNVPQQFKQAAKAADTFAKSTDNAAHNAESLSGALNGATANLMEFIGNAVGIYSVGQALASALTQAREWDGISARFAEGFADKVDEAYAHVMKLQEALYINDQAFMQYSSNFATLARGFGVAEHAIADMSIGLTELGYDIYAKNNDFYTFEEAMNAVRSAIVGEVEPIRRAGISIMESTLKETAAANGITQSVETMTEAQKAMLRYKAMVDQAYASSTVGTYIQELGTVEGSSRALAQQLKGLAQTIGSVLMPIVAAVMPYIQAFVLLLTKAIAAIGAFFGVSVKAPTWGSGMDSLADSAGGASDAVEDTTSALGGAAKAAKKLKDYTMGFDELNVIKPQDPSSGGGGGGGGGAGLGSDLGLDIDSLWTDAMIESATMKAEKVAQDIIALLQPLKEAILDIDFQPLLKSIKRLWKALKPFAATIGAGLYWFLMSVLVPLAAYTIENIIPDFLNTLAALLEWLTPQLQELGMWLAKNKDHIAKVGVALVAFFGAFKLVSWVSTALPLVKGFLTTLTGGSSIVTIFRGIITKLFTSVAALTIAFNVGGGGLGGVLAVVKVLFTSFGSTLLGILQAVISPFTAAVIVVASTAMVLAANWDKVVEVLKRFAESLKLQEKFDAIKTALSPLLEKLAGLKDLFTVIGTIGATVLAIAMGVVAGAFNAVISMVAPLIDAIGGVIDILAGLGSFIVAVFTGDWQKAWDSIKQIWDGIVSLFSGLWNAVVAGITGFVTGVIDWFKSLWNTLVGNSIVPDIINGIVSWFLSLPGKILTTIQNFVNAVVTFFSALWTSIKATWAGVANWFGTLFSNAWKYIRSAWESVTTWFSLRWTTIKTTFSAVPTYFKNMFTNAWTNIRNAWSTVTTWFSQRWTTIKNTFSAVPSYLSGRFSTAWANIKSSWATVTTWFSQKWTTIKNTFSAVPTYLKGKFSTAWTNIKSVFSGWSTFFSGLWNKISTTFKKLGTSIGTAVGNSVKAGINRILLWVQSTVNSAIRLINSAIDIINKVPGVEVSKIKTVSIPLMASGGYVGEGQMFIAREAGPEMVGTMNGRTAVANNDQIVEGISQGVYSAVLAAMSQGSSNNTASVNVYLDGKQITAAVEKRQRERGATIMTGGVTFGY